MPSGCDFVCVNENCDYFNTGFTITGPWPLGDIDEIISCSKVQSDDSLRNELLSLKDSGEKFARIVFPNEDNIEEKKTRLSFWDPDNLRINYIDIDIGSNYDVENPYFLSFEDVIEDGIECPKCNDLLNSNRWISI